MFLSGKPRLTLEKNCCKTPYLLDKYNSFSPIKSFTTSEFRAKHARRHDVSEHFTYEMKKGMLFCLSFGD